MEWKSRYSLFRKLHDTLDSFPSVCCLSFRVLYLSQQTMPDPRVNKGAKICQDENWMSRCFLSSSRKRFCCVRCLSSCLSQHLNERNAKSGMKWIEWEKSAFLSHSIPLKRFPFAHTFFTFFCCRRMCCREIYIFPVTAFDSSPRFRLSHSQTSRNLSKLPTATCRNPWKHLSSL